MEWNDPWIAYRVLGVIIFFVFVLIWAEAKFKEEDPRQKKREEEAKRKEEETARRRQFRWR